MGRQQLCCYYPEIQLARLREAVKNINVDLIDNLTIFNWLGYSRAK
jgi:hypothetical protein